MDYIMEVHNLSKSYGDVKAVKNVSFNVKKGSLFAFVGPNGAGKSTTHHILTTLLKPDNGEVIIDGHTLGKDDLEIRKEIGIVFQDGVLDKLLTVHENLSTRGKIYGLKGDELKNKIDEVMHVTGIEDLGKRRYGKLSGGQRRRVDIARALLNTPKILFLDEPTTGLDPQSRLHTWEMIEEIQEKSGMTIFLTTHYMEEADDADQVCIIDRGEIVASGTPTELKNEYSNDKLRIKPKDMDELSAVLTNDNVEYKVQNDLIVIALDDVFAGNAIVHKYRNYIKTFEILNGTLDDAFVNITGRELRE